MRLAPRALLVLLAAMLSSCSAESRERPPAPRAPRTSTPARPPPAPIAPAAPRPRIGDDCPAWTRLAHWREGEELVGVGMARGIRNPALLERTAAARALHNAARALPSTRGARRGADLRILAQETARCDGAVFAKVRARVSARRARS
jgi:hypothetical protein